MITGVDIYDKLYNVKIHLDITVKTFSELCMSIQRFFNDDYDCTLLKVTHIFVNNERLTLEEYIEKEYPIFSNQKFDSVKFLHNNKEISCK